MTGNGYTDERLRESLNEFAEAAADGQECLPNEQIWLSARGELEAAENEEVLVHVARCAACALAWRIARDMGSKEASVRRSPALRRFGRRARVSLAAAAVVVTAIGLGIYFRSEPERVAETVYRTQEGSSLKSALQEGARLPREEFVLVWAGGPEGTYYDLLVTTALLETLVQRAGLEATEFHVPPELLAKLVSGTKVLWQVTARLPDGRLIESATFIVVIE